MSPPVHPTDLHAAVGSRRRAVVYEQSAQGFFYFVRILITESCLFGKLVVDASFYDVQRGIYFMLHSHGIRGFFLLCLAVDAFCNLHAVNGYRQDAKG